MKNTNTSAYEAIYAMTELIDINKFSWKIGKGGKIEIVDDNKYHVIFDLQSNVATFETSTYNMSDEAEKENINTLHESNYVALMKDDTSIIQLHGKKGGKVIIEIRKKLYDKLECEKVKLFRECEKNEYKHIKRDYQLVTYNTEDTVKIIKEFIKRLEKGESKETDASEKVNESEKVG